MNREEILDIAKKLYHNHLTPELATDLLLRLFDGSKSVCKHEQVDLVRQACKCKECGTVMETKW